MWTRRASDIRGFVEDDASDVDRDDEKSKGEIRMGDLLGAVGEDTGGNAAREGR